MIKVLHVVPTLSINAGMMSVVMNYYRNIDRAKVQFDYLYFTDVCGNYIDEIHLLGGKTFCIGTPKPSFGYMKEIDKFFSKHKDEYIAIHCHPIFAPQIFANTAKRHGVKHVIAHSHSTRYSNKKLSAIRNYILNIFLGYFATDYMACSRDAVKLFGRTTQSKNVYILHNAIDSNNFIFNCETREKLRSIFQIREDELVIGHVGRFTNEKNHTFLIDVFNEYKKLNSNSRLLLVGDGPLMKKMKDKTETLQLSDSVIFTGMRGDIPALLSAMDIFILPSIFEGVPVSVVEAQATGLPCVISSNVTKEVGMLNSTYIPLSLPATEWARRLKEIEKNDQRINGKIEVQKNNYEISYEAKKLQDYYMALK